MGMAKRVATIRQLGGLLPAGALAFFAPDPPRVETPAATSSSPAPRPRGAGPEAVEDEDDGPPTQLSCAAGWYRRGATFYRIGEGPHPTFGAAGAIEIEMPPAPCGPAVQAMLF